MEISSPNSSKEFEEYYRLRWEILRKPWEKPVGSEKDELEDSSFHFMVKDNKHIVGVCRLQSNNPLEAQIRFMAVDESHQGKGIGSILLKACEEKANLLGCKKIILQSRENAVHFYTRNGYRVKEKSFLMWEQIQHYLMEKEI